MRPITQLGITVIGGLAVAVIAFFVLNESARNYGELKASKTYFLMSENDFGSIFKDVLVKDYNERVDYLEGYAGGKILLERINIENASQDRIHQITARIEGKGITISSLEPTDPKSEITDLDYSLKPNQSVELLSVSPGVTEYSFGLSGGRNITMASSGRVIPARNLVLNLDQDSDLFFLKFFREMPLVGIAAFFSLAMILLFAAVAIILEIFVLNQAKFLIEQTGDKDIAKMVAIYRAIHKLYPDRKAKIDQMAIGEFAKFAEHVRTQSQLNEVASQVLGPEPTPDSGENKQA